MERRWLGAEPAERTRTEALAEAGLLTPLVAALVPTALRAACPLRADSDEDAEAVGLDTPDRLAAAPVSRWPGGRRCPAGAASFRFAGAASPGEPGRPARPSRMACSSCNGRRTDARLSQSATNPARQRVNGLNLQSGMTGARHAERQILAATCTPNPHTVQRLH